MKHFTVTFFLLFSVSISADTTDVQLADVRFDNNQTVAVTCHFAEGSQALGCHAELSFSSDSEAVNISRVNRSFIACWLIKTRFPSHCYQSQLYVYDFPHTLYAFVHCTLFIEKGQLFLPWNN